MKGKILPFDETVSGVTKAMKEADSAIAGTLFQRQATWMKWFNG